MSKSETLILGRVYKHYTLILARSAGEQHFDSRYTDTILSSKQILEISKSAGKDNWISGKRHRYNTDLRHKYKRAILWSKLECTDTTF